MNSNLKIIKPLSISKHRKFGSVLLVQDTNNAQKYVLKHAKIHTITQQAFRQLKNESNFSFSIPYLPSIFKCYETDDSFSLLLTHKKGSSLTDFWQRIPKKQHLIITKLWVARLVELLNILHEQNIYHCDIKPSNIIIDQHNDNFTDFDLHLIDFGMALNKTRILSNTNSLIFPLGFAPPEQILQRYELINPSSDYFSIGISVFYLWANKLPLSHPNPSIFTNLQLAHPIPYLRNMPKELNTWLAKTCYKPLWKTAPNLMSKTHVDQLLIESFQKRYNDGKLFVQDLQKIQ